MARLKVKVVPGASVSAIVGWLGDALKVRVAAVPERGKANAAVIAVLARALGLAERDVRLVSGHTSPLKTLDVPILSDAELRQRLVVALRTRDQCQQ